MTRAAKPHSPSPVVVGNISARQVRGPCAEDAPLAEKDRRWYWRAFRGNEVLGVLGWLARADVARVVAERWTISGDDTETSATTLAGTVGALCDAYQRYIEERRDVAPNYRKATRQNLRHIREGIGGVRAGALTEATVLDYQNTRLGRDGAASVTVRDEVRALARAWKWGGSPGRAFAPRITFPTPKLKVMPRREKYTPPDTDIEATIAFINNPWAQTWLRLAYRTGVRAHEAGKMTVANVDLSAATVTVPYAPDEDESKDQRTKTGSRTIRVRADVVDMLASWIRERSLGADDWLLGVEPTNIHSKLGGYLTRAAEKAGVRPFTPHGVRRAAVRRFRRANIPPSVAAAYFGHSVQVMLGIYDEVSEEDHDDALALLDAYEERQATARKENGQGSPRLAVVTPASVA
jgi:integrase